MVETIWVVLLFRFKLNAYNRLFKFGSLSEIIPVVTTCPAIGMTGKISVKLTVFFSLSINDENV